VRERVQRTKDVKEGGVPSREKRNPLLESPKAKRRKMVSNCQGYRREKNSGGGSRSRLKKKSTQNDVQGVCNKGPVERKEKKLYKKAERRHRTCLRNLRSQRSQQVQGTKREGLKGI